MIRIIKSLFEKLFIRTKKCRQCNNLPRIEKWGNLYYVSCGEYHSPGVRLVHEDSLDKSKIECIKKWNKAN